MHLAKSNIVSNVTSFFIGLKFLQICLNKPYWQLPNCNTEILICTNLQVKAVLDTWTRLHIPNKTEDNTNKTTKLMLWYEAISTHGPHVWTTLGFASPPGPSDSLPSACCCASSRPCASYSPSIELDELADVVPVLGLRTN